MSCVYILLPVHNRVEITAQFVDCLVRQSFQDFHLILIDDGSVDGTAERVMTLLSVDKLTVLRGSGNWWWAGSLQQGIDWLGTRTPADDDVVLIINDDVSFTESFLAFGVAALATRPDTLLLARFSDPAGGATVETGVHADFRTLGFAPAISSEEINCAPTRGLFLRWADLRRIGGFRPALLPHYLSDYEFTIRAHRKGLTLVTLPELALQPDLAQTGLHHMPTMSLGRAIKAVFSNRSPHNPLHWSVFLLLCCPWRYIPCNLLRVWRHAAAIIVKSVRT